MFSCIIASKNTPLILNIRLIPELSRSFHVYDWVKNLLCMLLVRGSGPRDFQSQKTHKVEPEADNIFDPWASINVSGVNAILYSSVYSSWHFLTSRVLGSLLFFNLLGAFLALTI